MAPAGLRIVDFVTFSQVPWVCCVFTHRIKDVRKFVFLGVTVLYVSPCLSLLSVYSGLLSSEPRAWIPAKDNEEPELERALFSNYSTLHSFLWVLELLLLNILILKCWNESTSLGITSPPLFSDHVLLSFFPLWQTKSRFGGKRFKVPWRLFF